MQSIANHKPLQGYSKFYRQVLTGRLPKISLKFRTFNKARNIQTTYIRLQTSISNLKTHLFIIDKALDSLCWYCSLQKRQTTTHLLLQYPTYAFKRREIQDTLEGQPLKLKILFRTAIGRKALAAFLCSTKICTAQWFQATIATEDEGAQLRSLLQLQQLGRHERCKGDNRTYTYSGRHLALQCQCN